MRRKKSQPQIYPDEIFMDSENIPGFDTNRFEGRMEKPISKKSYLGIAAFFTIIILIFFWKIFSLQVLQGETLFLRSENNRLKTTPILPSRGIIYDRNGEKLAWNGYNSRLYSGLPGLSHVLGYIGLPSQKDIKKNEEILLNAMRGKQGIEKKYEHILGGKQGLKLIETDSQNNIISESVQIIPEKGDDVFLSIDSKVQSQFFRIMESIIKERGFHGGAGVLMDVNNGAILSLISYPEYDSSVLSAGEPKEIIDGFISAPNKPFLNRAVSGLYTPGSIIKPFVALASLNENVISPEKKIFDSGSISIPNPFFPDKKNVFYDWEEHGWVDMRKAIAFSCNVYFYQIGGGFENIKGLGIKKIEEYARKFGFGLKIGIDLEGEKKGLVPGPEWKMKNTSDPIWRIGDTYNISIGQGSFQVTPIQMAVFAAIIANNGKTVLPRLKRQSAATIVTPIDIPEKYFQIVKEGMRMAVTEGTASALDIPGIKIAAKTGTAQVGTAKKYVNSWIIGFLPYENPRFAFSIVLEKGLSENLVGALYVARQLFEWMSVNGKY